MSRTSSIPPTIQAAIVDFSDRGFVSAAAIRRELHGREEFADFRSTLPSARTINRFLAKAQTRDVSEPWRPFGSNERPEIIRMLVDVNREVIRLSQGRIRHVSIAEANRLTTIWLVEPTIQPWFRYRLAREYVRRGPDTSTDDLDLMLIVAPWRSTERRRVFWDAMVEGGHLEKATIAEFEELEEVGAMDPSQLTDLTVEIGSAVSFYELISAASDPNGADLPDLLGASQEDPQ